MFTFHNTYTPMVQTILIVYRTLILQDLEHSFRTASSNSPCVEVVDLYLVMLPDVATSLRMIPERRDVQAIRARDIQVNM